MYRSRIFNFLFHLRIRFADIFDREESGSWEEFTLLKLKLDILLIQSYRMILITLFFGQKGKNHTLLGGAPPT